MGTHNVPQLFLTIITDHLKYIGSSLVSVANYTVEHISKNFIKLIHTVKYIGEVLDTSILTTNVYRYIDIDSTYRNRIQYPLSSNFVIPYTNASSGTNANNASDPVSLAYPYAAGNTQAGSSTTQIVLDSMSSDINNFYINSLLSIQNQLVTITAYNAMTQTATVSPGLTSAPAINTPYEIRKASPIFYGSSAVLQAGSTQVVLNFPSSASSVDNYYAGMFILFLSGSNTGEVKVINSYAGSTQQATLATPLNNIPGTDSFEIDNFSYDNQTTFRYSGSRTTSQPCSYAVQLLQLTIPNMTLIVGYGGTVLDYPYLYVHFYNETLSSSGITMYGNNAHAGRATFRVAMSNFTNGAEFIVFPLINAQAYLPLKFSPTDSIRFRVTLPNGQDLAFVTADNQSPEIPNPLVQISALIAIKRLMATTKP